MVTPAVTVAPVDSVADTHTLYDPASVARPPIRPVAASKVAPGGNCPNSKYVRERGGSPTTIGLTTGRRSSAAPAVTDASPVIDSEKAAGGGTESVQCGKSDLPPHVKAGEIVSAWAGTARTLAISIMTARIILPPLDCIEVEAIDIARIIIIVPPLPVEARRIGIRDEARRLKDQIGAPICVRIVVRKLVGKDTIELDNAVAGRLR